MNNIKKIRVCPGMQMFLEYLAVLRGHPNVNFELLLDQNIIKHIRPQYPKSWSEDLTELLKFLCRDLPNVTVIEKGEGTTEAAFISNEHILAQDVARILNTQPQSLPPASESDLFGRSEKGNYVVMNTKCMSGVDYDLHESWNVIKDEMFKVFNDNNITVKIIGERKYNDCSELSLHGAFSIYQDIIDGGIKNLEDLTKKDSLSLYNVQAVVENMTILKRSFFNIHIGEGGGQSVYAHMNDVLSLTRKSISPENNKMFSYIKNPNFAINTDRHNFISLLKEKLEQEF